MMITELDPGADPRLAAVFAAATAPAELPLAGEPQALAVYRRSQGESRFPAILGPRPVHMVAAALFSGVLLAGGVATAATGSVPIVGHHQSAPSAGITADDGQTDTDAGADSGSSAADDATNDIGDSGPGTAGHPDAPPALGSVAKGAATCAAASHGTCRAGRHGKALAAHNHHHGRPDTAGAARSTPKAGAHHGAAHRSGFVPSRGAHRTTHLNG